jgi:CBS domain-containing protein
MEAAMIVSQLMTKTVWRCKTTDHLEVPAQLMWDHDIGCVPVVEGGAVVGMITDRDICMAAHTHGLPLVEIAVTDAMSRTLWSCFPDDDVGSVARRMAMHQLHRMPVIDFLGRLVGIVTLNDLARAARRSGSIAPAQVSYTLSAIACPRLPQMRSSA